MKKLVALLLVLVMCVGLFAACGPAYDVEGAAEFLYESNVYDEGKETPNNYQLVGIVIVDGLTYTVEWSCDNANITFEKSADGKIYTVKVPNPNAESFLYELTAKVSAPNGASVEKKFNRVMPVTEADVTTTEVTPGVAYKLYIKQANIGKNLFAVTDIDGGRYVEMVEDYTAAPDFFVEESGEGYKIFTMISGAKKYLNAYLNENSKTALSFEDSTESVWTFGDHNAWWTTINGGQYFIGNYNTYETVSLSEAQHASKDGQNKAGFITAEDAANLPSLAEPQVIDSTIANILAIANETYSFDFYKITVTIKTAPSGDYGNCDVTDGTNDLYIYGLYMDDNGQQGVRFDKMDYKPVVGDTITIYGSIGTYNDVAQMKNARITSIVKGEGGDTPVDPEPEEPDVPADGPVYNVTNTLNAGDKVLIAAPAYNKLLSMVKTGFYNVGVDYTATSFANVTDDEIFVVGIDGDGNYTFTSLSGKVLALADSYGSLNDTGTNVAWELEAQATAGIFYVKNVARGNYLEWYDSKSNWSTYSPANSDLFEISFYLVEAAAGGDTPVDPEPEEPEEPEVPEDPEEPEVATMPYTVGNQYFFGFTNGGVTYWLDGTNAGGKNYRWNYTTDYTAAIKYTLESAGEEGKYYITYTVGGTKTYLNIKAVVSGSNTYYNLLAEASPVNAWEWNSDESALTVTVEDGTVCIPKNYNNYTNVEAKAVNFTQGSTFSLTLVEIPEETDALKLDNVKGRLDIDTAFGADGELVLPAEDDVISGITITWTVNGNEVVGSYAIVQTDAVQTLAVVATIKSGDATVTKEFTVTVSAKLGAEGGTLATFEFGANGSAAHVDGNDLGTSKTYESNGQTLVLENMTKVYGPAFDAAGNSAIKLGTSKLNGSFSFTVGADVDQVVIKVAQYKDYATTVTINGQSYTISGASNNGVYDEITIDTTTVKTVEFATAGSTYRCMIDSISFVSLGE